MKKTYTHFVSNYLLNPTNPVTINLIGVGGTGSHLLYALDSIHKTLIACNHPGLFVRAFDGDKVTSSNVGRQRFFEQEIGLNKAVAIVNRINRQSGHNWKAIPFAYHKRNWPFIKEEVTANITLTCIDTIKGRFEIALLLRDMAKKKMYYRDRPYYWMDFGNDRYTGQVVLSTVGTIEQPESNQFIAVGKLPFITEEFKNVLLAQTSNETNTPSCSLAEAVNKQDLFINPSMANLGASLLWSLFRGGKLENKGFFLNLKDFRSQPMKIRPDTLKMVGKKKKKKTKKLPNAA